MTAVRVRFAPSPTGLLHLGTARTALFNWLMARSAGGTFVVRIEDTDTARSSREHEASLLADLRWLGLDWDEGPEVGGPHGPYRQSERLDRYRLAAFDLLARDLAYRCFCDPATLAAHRDEQAGRGLNPGYPGICAGIDHGASDARVAAGESFAIRLRVASVPRPSPGPEGEGGLTIEDRIKGRVSFEQAAFEDFIIMRSTGVAAYLFAVVLDDVAMAITDVVRGEDLLPSTPRQLLVYAALGAAPPRFAHLPMVLGPDQAKLSKRHGAVSVGDYREQGLLPSAILNAIALVGWSPGDGRDLLTLEELLQEFRIERVSRRNAVLDLAKLRWFNGQHLRRLEPGLLLAAARPGLAAIGLDPETLAGPARDWLQEVLAAGVMSVDLISELLERVAPVFSWPAELDAKAQAVLAQPGAAAALRSVRDELGSGAEMSAIVGRTSGALGCKPGQVLKPLRVALTGRLSGMELDRVLALATRGSELLPGRIPSPVERLTRALGEP